MLADANLFKTGMRRLVSGVSIVTTADGGHFYGLVATSVSSLSADPPSIIFCINQKSQSHEHILKSQVFCVNLVRYADQELARRFSENNRLTRFELGDWFIPHTGAPALRNALASFDCQIVNAVSHHTHTVIIGEVKSIHLAEHGCEPLLYGEGRYLTSGVVSRDYKGFYPS